MIKSIEWSNTMTNFKIAHKADENGMQYAAIFTAPNDWILDTEGNPISYDECDDQDIIAKMAELYAEAEDATIEEIRELNSAGINEWTTYRI